MILSDKDIKEYLRLGKISVTPFRPECVQPASVDLHLDRTVLIFDTVNHHIIDVRQPVDNLMRRVEIDEDKPFILHPGEFALGATYEEIGVGDDVVGRLEGKSSLGRLGIIIHATAGYHAGNGEKGEKCWWVYSPTLRRSNHECERNGSRWWESPSHFL